MVGTPTGPWPIGPSVQLGITRSIQELLSRCKTGSYLLSHNLLRRPVHEATQVTLILSRVCAVIFLIFLLFSLFVPFAFKP